MLTYSISNKDTVSITADCTLDLVTGETITFDLKSGGHWFGHGFNQVQVFYRKTGFGQGFLRSRYRTNTHNAGINTA